MAQWHKSVIVTRGCGFDSYSEEWILYIFIWSFWYQHINSDINVSKNSFHRRVLDFTFGQICPHKRCFSYFSANFWANFTRSPLFYIHERKVEVALPLNTQCLQNSAESGKRNILTLHSPVPLPAKCGIQRKKYKRAYKIYGHHTNVRR